MNAYHVPAITKSLHTQWMPVCVCMHVYVYRCIFSLILLKIQSPATKTRCSQINIFKKKKGNILDESQWACAYWEMPVLKGGIHFLYEAFSKGQNYENGECMWFQRNWAGTGWGQQGATRGSCFVVTELSCALITMLITQIYTWDPTA